MLKAEAYLTEGTKEWFLAFDGPSAAGHVPQGLGNLSPRPFTEVMCRGTVWLPETVRNDVTHTQETGDRLIDQINTHI